MHTPSMERSMDENPRVGGNSKVDPLYVESGEAISKKHVYTTESAHVVDRDSWGQVGLMLVTGFNCAYIFSYSSLIMVSLGWTWGIICLITIGGFSFYSNWVLAGFHVIDGQRFIRYRDIMGFVFGRKMYYITYILQFLTLILGNMGFLLLGGKALKGINGEFSDSPKRLQVFIVVNAVAYFIFANIAPNLSAMRYWLGASAAITMTYIVVTLPILVEDGKANKSKDYNLRGNEISKVLNAFGAIATIVVSNNSGLLPEIQSTLRKPVVKNMRKALSMQFTFGLLLYYGMTVAGYWAYGSSVSDYIPTELSGRKWRRILINSLAFIQNMISQHIFLAPVHEALDTKFLNLKESMCSKYNIARRALLRAVVFGLNTLVTAAFPFMGDFLNLLGSFALLPLSFMFPSMIFIWIKGKSVTRWSKAWHWAIIVIFSALTIVTTTAAVRLIVHNTKTYDFFADT